MGQKAKDITNLYLFDQVTKPSDLLSDGLIRPEDVGSGDVYDVEITSFMNTGAGRFAIGAQFDLIEKFFTEYVPVGTYTKEQLAQTYFGMGHYGWVMNQYDFRDEAVSGGKDDYAERVYIFNTMEFAISDSATFVVTGGGQRYIEGFSIIPRTDVQENFDFNGGGFAALLNPTLEAAIDPSGIGRKVDINFVGTPQVTTYNSQNFLDDLALKLSWDGLDLLKLNSDMAELARDLWGDNGPTQFIADGKPIVYGTTGGDNLDADDVQGSTWADFNDVPTIADSDYETMGLVFVGGAGNDTITGSDFDDSIYGGVGNDILDGGSARFVLDTTGIAVSSDPNMLFGGAGIDTYVLGNPLVVFAAELYAITPTIIDDSDGQLTLRISDLTAVMSPIISTFGTITDYDFGVHIVYDTSTKSVLIIFTPQPTENSPAEPILSIVYGMIINVDSGFTASPTADGLGINITYTPANVTVTGDSGDNTITGSNGNDSLSGVDGNDTLIGLAGNDTLIGGSGNDSLEGGEGTNSLVGGLGNDTYLVSSAADTITEALNEGMDVVKSSASYVLSDNLENLILLDSSAAAAALPAVDAREQSYLFAAGIRGVVSSESESGISGTGNILDNYITGNSWGNLLSGVAGNDTLDGGTGDDSLLGGDGNDLLIGGVGSDYIDGGTGTDTVSYVASTAWVNVDLAANNHWNGDAAWDNILNVENIIGSFYNDQLTGDAGANQIEGGEGNDVITGNAGDDVLNGGNGNDTLLGSDGNDLLTGGVGSDYIDGGNGIDTISYAASSAWVNVDLNANNHWNGDAAWDNVLNVENIIGSAYNDQLLGNSGANQIVGGNGADSITGYAGDDVLDGGAGNDTMIGGLGNDTFIVDSTLDVVTENNGEGTDSIFSSVTYSLVGKYAENMTLTGSASINATGNSFNNILIGNSGNNSFDGLGGVDTLAGGAGNDTYTVDSTTDVITENAGEGTDTVISSVSFNLGAGVENLTLSGASAINGTGNSHDNVLTGNSSNNALDGLGGNDTLIGGLGNDTYTVDAVGDVVTENAGEGTDTIISGVSYTLASNVENLTLSGVSSINGTGNSLDNVLIGNSGDNLLDGLGGTDTLIGGAGNDSYNIDSNTDVITENTGEGADTVISSISYTLGTNLENMTLSGAAALNATGNALNNVLMGNSGNNILSGGIGNDTLVGGAGADTFVISANATTATVNDFVLGTDKLDLRAFPWATSLSNLVMVQNGANTAISLGGVTLTLLGITTSALSANDFILSANSGAIINGTSASETIAGTAAADAINGLAGNDSITGSSGDDVIDGGTGNDTMVGSTGNDTYVVDSTSDVVTENNGEGTDTIYSSVTYTLAGRYAENITLTGSASINATGNFLNNLFVGNSGDNLLDGLSGNDTMIGGFGNDTYTVDAAGDIITENASEGVDTVMSSISYTLGSNLENLTLSGAAVINGTGNSLDNVLMGNSANNVLSGADGNDTLEAGSGTDTLSGGVGMDTFRLLNAATAATISDFVVSADKIDLRDLTSVTTISGVTIAQNGADATVTVAHNGSGNGNIVLTLIGVTASQLTANDFIFYTPAGAINGTSGADTLVGTAGADTINGLAGNDSITGGNGNDTIDGGTGNDTMVGGLGNDTYVVDSVSDVVTEVNSEGTDTILSSVSYSLGGKYADNITLTGTAAINATGNSLSNVLIGNGGNNLLDGVGSNDTLIGGLGADTLTGGVGTELFIYQSTVDSGIGAGNRDIITDFSQAQGDKIDLSAFTGTFAFLGTGAFTGGANAEVRYFDDGTNTIVQVDANHDGTADFEIQANGHIAFASGDFVL